MSEEERVKLNEELVSSKIFLVRGLKVMLDQDLSELYQVQTKVLNQAVKRNSKRFPEDFMFQLKPEEWQNLKSQIVTSSWGGRRTEPFAFTEQGVAMLSSVLNSDTAIDVNIQIIRVFTKMRELLMSNKDILLKLEKIEKKATEHDEDIQVIFKYLKKLLNEPNPPRKAIGYKRKDE
jgi:hypothetical protein